MKKIAAFAALAAIALPLSAFDYTVLHPVHRYFEIGVKADAGVSNSYFDAKEYLVKDLVIDLRKIADEMPDSGLSVDAYASPCYQMNLNLDNGFHFGLETGVEASGWGMVSKDLFKFLGYGNAGASSMSFDGDMTGDAFYHVSTSVGFRLGKVRITATPSVFVPIAHADADNFKVSFTNSETGKTTATGAADVTLYTFTSAQSLFEGRGLSGSAASDAASSIGADLAGAVEFPLVEKMLQVGAYLRMPIVPGTLRNTTSMTISGIYEVDSLAGLLSSSAQTTQSFNVSDKTYGTAEFRISRPLRAGAELAWRPFGEWFTFSALAGLGVRYPFTDAAVFYPEYNIGMDTQLFHVLGIGISTGYFDKLFMHQLNIMINCRILEIDAGVSLQGENLVQSFKGTGLGAHVGVFLGF
jgi:hypothetical protein